MVVVVAAAVAVEDPVELVVHTATTEVDSVRAKNCCCRLAFPPWGCSTGP